MLFIVVTLVLIVALAYRIGLDVKWYTGRVTATVVTDEIEEGLDNDCDTVVLICRNGWTSGAESVANNEDRIDVVLAYPPDDMRELEEY